MLITPPIRVSHDWFFCLVGAKEHHVSARDSGCAMYSVAGDDALVRDDGSVDFEKTLGKF